MNNFFHKISTALRLPLVKNLFIFSFGSLLLRGISIFLAPITMSILDPKDYGILALANSFVSVFVVFIGLGLRQAFSIEYFHCTTERRKTMLNSMILMYLAVATPLILIASLYPSVINRLIFMNSASTTLILLSLAYSFLYFFVEFFYQVLTYHAQALRMMLIQTSIAILIIALNLLFLCWFKWGVISLMAGQVIGLVIIFGIGLRAYIKTSCHLHLNIRHTITTCGTYIKLGFPFVPGTLCGWILASSDRWVLARSASMHDVGIYSLATVFGQLFYMLIIVPLSGAYIPHVLKKFAENKDNPLPVERWNRKNMIYSMVGLSIAVTVGYLACKPLLHFFLPVRYQPAISYIWIIVMGNIFLMGEHFASIFVIFNKKAYFQAASLLVPSALNLSLNLLLVPHLKIMGCVLSTLVAYIAYFGIKLTYNLSLQKKINARYGTAVTLSSIPSNTPCPASPLPQQKVPESSTSRQQL